MLTLHRAASFTNRAGQLSSNVRPHRRQVGALMTEAFHTQVSWQIRIGGATKAELLRSLANARVEINQAGQQLFADDRFQTLELPSIVESVQTTAEGLGLQNGGTLTEIAKAAAAAGLSLCPLELGPRLRLALRDQAEGSEGFALTRHKAPPGSITVASAPLSEDDETPKGFYLRRTEGTLWLRGYRSWSGHLWEPADVFIFARTPNAA